MPKQFLFELVLIIVCLLILVPTIVFGIFVVLYDKGAVKNVRDFLQFATGYTVTTWPGFIVVGVLYFALLSFSSATALSVVAWLFGADAALALGLTGAFGFRWKNEQGEHARKMRSFCTWWLVPLTFWALVAALVRWVEHGLGGWWG